MATVPTTEDIRDEVLRIWIEELGSPSFSDFIASRTEWERVAKIVHNSMGVLLDHEETKAIVRGLDKDGSRTCSSVEEAKKKQEERRQNQKEWNHTAGKEGLESLVERIANSPAVRMNSPAHAEYIGTPRWKQRRRLRAQTANWQCAVCGHRHPEGASTLHIHHNTYESDGYGKGEERDEDLTPVCEGFCHRLADIARAVRQGRVAPESLNDALRTLLHGLDDDDCDDSGERLK